MVAYGFVCIKFIFMRKYEKCVSLFGFLFFFFFYHSYFLIRRFEMLLLCVVAVAVVDHLNWNEALAHVGFYFNGVQ